jgi:3-hydroxybutyryl-CoA dehydratase
MKFSDLRIGMSASLRHQVTDRTVELFGEATGDRNPLHFDDAFAAATLYGGRVAHGALLVGFVSAVLATELPGPGSVAREMSIRFRKPVRPGEVVVSKVVVRELVAKTRKVVLDCFSYVGDDLVARGEASALLPD